MTERSAAWLGSPKSRADHSISGANADTHERNRDFFSCGFGNSRLRCASEGMNRPKPPARNPQTIAQAGLSGYTLTRKIQQDSCQILTPAGPAGPNPEPHMFGITDRRHFLQHSAAGAAITLPGLNFL